MFERIPEPEIMQNKDQCELYNQEFLDCPEIILDFINTYTEFCGLTEGTVVDLGSGSCNFVIALCKKYPRLKFIVSSYETYPMLDFQSNYSKNVFYICKR